MVDIATQLPNTNEPRKHSTIRPGWTKVRRRGPLLKPSRSAVEVYGLDITAGCAHRCGYCYIRGSAVYPGEDKLLFDPDVVERLRKNLDSLDEAPRQVVLCPSCDPLPPIREIRRATLQVVELLLSRGIPISIMTRGRIDNDLIEVLAKRRDIVQTAIGVTTLDRKLSRTLEPWAAPPWKRCQGIKRLIAAEIPVEIRLEPMIAGLTDTRENLRPLFGALARLGARRVVAHYLFLHNSMVSSLTEALDTLRGGEKLLEAYQEGPEFALGSIGQTKHLPVEDRRAGLARLTAWGSEFGLSIETGSTQNPDLRRAEPQAKPQPPITPIIPAPT